MGSYELDDVDRQIPHLLQEDARSISTGTIGLRDALEAEESDEKDFYIREAMQLLSFES